MESRELKGLTRANEVDTLWNCIYDMFGVASLGIWDKDNRRFPLLVILSSKQPNVFGK
jgi:hypothetical protein